MSLSGDDAALSPAPTLALTAMAQITPASVEAEAPLPEGWEKVHSRSRPGEISYRNMKTGRRTRVRPAEPADAAVSPAPTPASAVASQTPSQTITTTTPTPNRSAIIGRPITVADPNPEDAPPPFTMHFEYAPRRTAARRKRHLYFYAQIMDVDVDVMQGTAFVSFFLKAAWSEPEIYHETDPTKWPISEKMTDFNHEADPTKWPEGLFDPKLVFQNSTGRYGGVTITEPRLELSPWRTGLDREPVVEYSFFGRGMFKQDFELEDFPFDLHPIRISITSALPSGLINLMEDTTRGVSNMRPECNLTQPEFYFPAHLTMADGGRTGLPMLFSDTFLRPGDDVKHGGRPSPILHIKCIAERIPNFYFWNVYVPTLLIVCMVSGAFVIDPIDVNDRYSVTLTLTLVSVTYK